MLLGTIMKIALDPASGVIQRPRRSGLQTSLNHSRRNDGTSGCSG
jgi:hypothetical protein